MPSRERRDQVAGKLRQLLLLRNQDVATLPTPAHFVQDGTQDCIERLTEGHSEIVDLNHNLSRSGQIPSSCQAQKRVNDIRGREKTIELRKTQTNCFQRKSFGLPRFDPEEAFDIGGAVQAVTTLGPRCSQEPFPFEEPQAGMAHVGVDTLKSATTSPIVK